MVHPEFLCEVHVQHGLYNARMEAAQVTRWLFGPEPVDAEHPGHLMSRWIFLRALGLIYFSAFYSLFFQIKGLIGPEGILPAKELLPAVSNVYPGIYRFWFAPTLLWFSSSNHMLMLICWLGVAASIAVILNLWPRAALFVCFVCFLSFIAAAQDFASYQSDGMLLEAGFISLFFAPPGLRPRFGALRPPSRASLFLLRWEWFRIYFESGVVKLTSGDYSWRHLTAMDDYYQNGPLPTWVGYYVQHLPHWFHAATALMTLIAELGLIFMLFLPRRWKIICFCIVTPFQIGIIITANYTFLNYLVLCLGFLLLDDKFLRRFLPQRWRADLDTPLVEDSKQSGEEQQFARFAPLRWLKLTGAILAAWCLIMVFYVTTIGLLATLPIGNPFPEGPARMLEPFRIANRYGLFAVMTHQRYEIEFQGSNDGKTWTPYPFRYKPQDPNKAPGIYAPYQPRFEWNLWFASLEDWRNNKWLVRTEERLLRGQPDVLALFSNNPFASAPPQRVRVVIWQYWFTTLEEKRRTGAWWNRKLLGEYAPGIERTANGDLVFTSEQQEPQTDQR
jgi:lipase maturation factor